MKTTRPTLPLLLAALLASALARPALAEESTGHVALSDPAKPATLRIRVWQGDVTVHGEDVKDVTVKTDSTAEESPPRDDGMRVLSASSSYRLGEKDNVVTLEYGADGSGGAPADFDITVPRATSVVVANSIRGDLECKNLSGDIDVRTIHGDVKADDVSGGVCIESMNGEITVNMASVAPSKPLSLTSMNGKIAIRLPSAAKATIRLRTHHGLILTNFDDKALVTRTEISEYREHSRRRDSGDTEAEAPTAPAAPAAPVAASAPAEPSADAAPMPESDVDWHAEVRDAMREASEAMREASEEIHAQFPRMPQLPPMTGGKVVSGSLNGGGAEIQAATLNGDIVLKKAD
jgi:hypothetical protein